ncbi:DUF7470 family protein [Natronosalvus rutilus]|uniref:Uncharacterized protein n=1 Tax=Natronosalvus rutilus TaxID=2953753 RepID=A0A9E7NB60_9EURY|nr:hypothetical protein [Natronosalvus rutilus]UTF54186.1 hypothetical protein NGM29_02560 [Natronosalvus rutilus]
MRKSLGPLGILGVILAIAGIALIATQNYLIAGGLALMLIGVALVVKSLVTGVLQSFGMV